MLNTTILCFCVPSIEPAHFYCGELISVKYRARCADIPVLLNQFSKLSITPMSLQDVDEKLLYDTFSAFGVIVTNPKVKPLLLCLV